MAFEGAQGNIHHLAALTHLEPGEEPQLDELSLMRVDARQTFQGLAEEKGVDLRGRSRRRKSTEGHPLPASTALVGLARSPAAGQDLAHGHAGNREEMGAVIGRDRSPIQQPHAGLVHEVGHVQGMRGAPPTQDAGRQLSQTSVQQALQLVPGLELAFARPRDRLRNGFVHPQMEPFPLRPVKTRFGRTPARTQTTPAKTLRRGSGSIRKVPSGSMDEPLHPEEDLFLDGIWRAPPAPRVVAP